MMSSLHQVTDRIRSWLSPPDFHNMELNRQARLLNVVIWSSIVVGLLRIFAPVDNRLANAVIVLIFVAVLLGLLRLLQDGRIRLASHLLVGSLWLIITISNLFFGGVRGPAYSAYTMLITIAGLLLGGRSAIFYALLCTAAGGALYLLEDQGLTTSNAESRTLLASFSGTTPNFISIAILVYVFHRSFLQALERARQNEEELAQSNRELATIRATLEEQVAERTFRAEQARQEAEEAKQALELRIWKATGQAELNKITRGDQELKTLANNVIAAICRYLQLPVGLLFIRQENNLSLIGSYAFESGNGTIEFALGEGMVGQAAIDQEMLILGQSPAPTGLTISSGLGQMQPEHVAVLPLVFERETIAVLELGSWRPLTTIQTEFLQEVNNSLAAAIRAAQTHSQVSKLLKENS